MFFLIIPIIQIVGTKGSLTLFGIHDFLLGIAVLILKK